MLINWSQSASNQVEKDLLDLQLQLTFAFFCLKFNLFEEYNKILKEVLLTYGNEFEGDEITLYKAVLWSDLSLQYFGVENIAESAQQGIGVICPNTLL